MSESQATNVSKCCKLSKTDIALDALQIISSYSRHGDGYFYILKAAALPCMNFLGCDFYPFNYNDLQYDLVLVITNIT